MTPYSAQVVMRIPEITDRDGEKEGRRRQSARAREHENTRARERESARTREREMAKVWAGKVLFFVRPGQALQVEQPVEVRWRQHLLPCHEVADEDAFRDAALGEFRRPGVANDRGE